jgi:hypothetical protein
MYLSDIDDRIWVDGNQDYAPRAARDKRFSVAQLEWEGTEGRTSCDVAWRHKKRLYMMEEKKLGDFHTSTRSRRLQRQLRGIVTAAYVPVIGIRQSALYSGDASLDNKELLDIASWAPRGYIVLLPVSAKSVFEFLPGMVQALTSSKARILAGTDKKRPRAAPFEQSLMRLFDGIGAARAKSIALGFKTRGVTTVREALNCDESVWKDAGAHVGIRRQLEDM